MTEGVLADFRQEMERVAELRDYEAAAEIRDRIAEIERVFVWNRRLIDSVNRNHMILMVPGIEPDTTDLFCVRYGRFAGELTIRRRFPHAGLTKLLERVYNRRDIGAAIDDPIDIDEVRLLASYLKNNGDRGARIPIAARGKINVAMIVDQVLDHHRVRKSRPVAEQEQAKNVGRDGTFRAP